MTDKKIKSEKRKTLKAALVAGGTIAASGAAPQKWTRPVVNSVTLPAHASATQGGGDPSGGTTVAPTTMPPAQITCTVIADDSFTSSPFPPLRGVPVRVSGQTIPAAPGINLSIEVTTVPGDVTLMGNATTNAGGAFGPVALSSINSCLLGNNGGPITINVSITGEGYAGGCMTTYSKGSATDPDSSCPPM